MFYNEEDEENQYAGLVARGRSSYTPQRSINPTPASPPAAAARTSGAFNEPASTPALEERTSSTASFPPRASASASVLSHDPLTDEQRVNTTLTLLKKMQQIVVATSDASDASRINRYQAALASRRMKLISTTLRQLPHPAPSPRLLTALQSLCLLVRQCAYDPADDDEAVRRLLYGPDEDPLGLAQCWPVLLRQHFTCRLLFRSAYRRLWMAWRMYSPMLLEHEDTVAEAKDRNVDADTMLRRLFAVQDSRELEAKLPAVQAEQHKRDMLAYYQRREMSPWRVFHHELKLTGQTLTPVHQPPFSSSATQRSTSSSPPEAEESDYRFRVLPNVYKYNGVPVVVKAFCASASAASSSSAAGLFYNDCDAETEAAAMTCAADFLQDVACRCTWCHPHVVGCLGAYTEKFTPAAAPTTDGRAKEHGEQPSTSSLAPASPSSTPAVSAQTSTPAVDLPWSRSVDTASGAPVMALGYINELQTSTEDPSTPCLTLGDMLFPSSTAVTADAASTSMRHYFTVAEALDICAQMADALQYLQEDCGDVPAAVQTSWLTLDPFNVYVVRTVSKEGPTTDMTSGGVGLARATKKWSAAFTGSLSFTGGGGSAIYTAVGSGNNSLGNSHDAYEDVVVTVPETGLAEREQTPLLHPALQIPVHVDPVPGGDGSSPPQVDGSVFVATAHSRSSSSSNNNSSVGDVSPVSPQRGSLRFVVRFCPPSDWTNKAVGSRWRPHPRATAPASYAVAQLFLALLTRQVPYAAYTSDAEVQRRVFDISASPITTADVQVKLSSSGQGCSIPSSLSPTLAQWCRSALSLDKSQPSMDLESLRRALTVMIQASLSQETAGSSPAIQNASYATSPSAVSQEMHTR